MSDLKLVSVTPWFPVPRVAPESARADDGTFVLSSNGTRTCAGGWQLLYSGVEPGKWYEISVPVTFRGLDYVRDNLAGFAYWGEIDPALPKDGSRLDWDHLVPVALSGDTMTLARRVEAVGDGDKLTLRYVFRWANRGTSTWQLPCIAAVPRPELKTVRACVVTGAMFGPGGTQGAEQVLGTVDKNLRYYAGLCEQACRAVAPDLIVLPEIALQYGVEDSPLDTAVAVPGAETDAFARIAREHGARIVLGLYERDEDAVYNSAVLISPGGEIDGRYRKCHFAFGEDLSGITPGTGFPVFTTEVGRIGCNICMDTSAAESSRMVGLNGADILCFPIMGDNRADRWSRGAPIFNEGRWRAIMRTRAIDNQYCLVVARNTAQGSCIIDRKGDVLAWNEGDRDFISAEFPLGEGSRTWCGASFRAMTWMLRRPHLFAEFSSEANIGALEIGALEHQP